MKKLISSLLLLSFLLPEPHAWPALQPGDKQFSPAMSAGVMANPGFEFGVQKWTASAGTLTTTTTAANVFAGNAAGSWAATGGAGRTLVSTITYTNGGGPTLTNGSAGCMVKCASGTCTHTFTVDDGSTNLATPVTVTSSTTGFVPVAVNYVAGTGGTIRPKFTSVSATEPTLYIDGCWAGSAQVPGPNLGSVAQAQFMGAVVITGCAANWTTTSTSFTDPATQASCSYSASGLASAPATNLPAIKFANGLPAGEYLLQYEGTWGNNTANKNAYTQFTDGTNTARETSLVSVGTGATGGWSSGISQSISYSSTQGSTTFKIQMKTDSSGNAQVYGTTGAPGTIRVYRFPTASQLVMYPDAGGLAAGDFVSTGSSTCPTGTIAADGTSYLRTDYPALYASIGTTYGSADGTHFTVPDRRGVFERGAGSQTISAITYTGTQGTTQGDQFQGHFHTGNGSGSNEFIYNRAGSGVYAAITSGTAFDRTTVPAGAASTDGSHGTPRTGSETQPANISAKVCIRTVAATPAPVFVGSVTAPQNTSGNTVVNNWVTKSANYTATTSDETIVFTADATLSLPAAANVQGKKYHVISSGSGTDVTIDPNASETVCGRTTILLSGDEHGEIQSDGTNWIGLGDTCKTFHWAKVVCSTSASITSQSGDFLSTIGNISSGCCALTFQTGVFGATPGITSSVDGAGSSSTNVVGSSATSATAGSVCGESGGTTTYTANIKVSGYR